MRCPAFLRYALYQWLKTSASVWNKAPILCDGAMGTLLYSKGIFINRCYDELNLSQPDLIRAIHHDYLQCGRRNY